MEIDRIVADEFGEFHPVGGDDRGRGRQFAGRRTGMDDLEILFADPFAFAAFDADLPFVVVGGSDDGGVSVVEREGAGCDHYRIPSFAWYAFFPGSNIP